MKKIILFLRKYYHERRGKPKEKINWLQELRIAFFTSILFLLFTTGILWIAHRTSPGEYTGDKLEQFFVKELADTLDLPRRKANIAVQQQVQADASGALETDTIVLCGVYSPGADEVQAGRFISVWERREHSFWNELLGTNARYDIVSLQVSSEEHDMLSTLACEGVRFDDLNGDGLDEIHVLYHSNFADRRSRANIFLFRSHSGWSLVTPDFTGVEDEILAQIDEGGFLMTDEFTFYDPNEPSNQKTVYSLAMYGTVLSFENPLWGGYDFLYCIAVNNNTSILATDHCALVMMRFTSDLRLVRDPNWNMGKAHVAPYEDLDIDAFVEENWGLRMESGTVFYGSDVG